MTTTSIPRQLLIFTALFAIVTSAGSLMCFLMVSSAYQESNRSAAAGIGELTRTFTLLERVNAVEDALQRLVRLKDPDAIEKALRDIDAQRAQIAELTTAIGPAGAPIRAEYERAVAAEHQVTDAVLKGDGGSANDRFMEIASPRYEAVKASVRNYFGIVQQDTVLIMAENAAQGRRRTVYQLFASSLVLIAVIALMWRLRHRIIAGLVELTATLVEAGGQLAETSDQVTASSQTVSDGANRQAAAIEETSASLEEIGATASQNAGHAQQAKDIAAEARASAETGHHDMKEMISAMDAIKASSGAIAGIIKTIDEIAFQTNLLALNAAVEAARAGQAGLGFAVVADEVRGLAQRSATAARETAMSVEEVIAKSDRGVQVSGKVANSLEDIVARARRVDSLVAEIAVASNQQRLGIEQVSRAMADIEKVTQAGAASAEETAATVMELNAQTDALRNVVQELQSLAGDGQSRARAAVQPRPPVAAPAPFTPRRAA
jgi:methyl-accepting chemotaxis protein